MSDDAVSLHIRPFSLGTGGDSWTAEIGPWRLDNPVGSTHQVEAARTAWQEVSREIRLPPVQKALPIL